MKISIFQMSRAPGKSDCRFVTEKFVTIWNCGRKRVKNLFDLRFMLEDLFLCSQKAVCGYIK